MDTATQLVPINLLPATMHVWTSVHIVVLNKMTKLDLFTLQLFPGICNDHISNTGTCTERIWWSRNKILKQWLQSATIYLLSRNTANFDRMKTDSLLQISSSEIHIPSGVPRGGVGVSNPPSKFQRPSKIVPNSTRLWKLLKTAEFWTPIPQGVRKKRQ